MGSFSLGFSSCFGFSASFLGSSCFELLSSFSSCSLFLDSTTVSFLDSSGAGGVGGEEECGGGEKGVGEESSGGEGGGDFRGDVD